QGDDGVRPFRAMLGIGDVPLDTLELFTQGAAMPLQRWNQLCGAPIVRCPYTQDQRMLQDDALGIGMSNPFLGPLPTEVCDPVQPAIPDFVGSVDTGRGKPVVLQPTQLRVDLTL